MQYGFVIDQTKCIGCHACSVACKTEHDVPLGVNRTWVKYVEKGEWPDTKRFFSVMRCNHCSNAPCVTICPTKALHHRKDGIVDFDTERCIGCKSCMQACPYDALYIDPGENTAQKCNYCVHRVEVGIEPACVVVCPEQAIVAGDLHDPTTRIAQMVATDQLFQRAPEQGTSPNLWYKGAESANLDPLAATSLSGGGGIWRDTEPAVEGSWLAVDLTPKNGDRPAGSPGVVHSEKEPPRVTYNTDHPAPWGWRVSSYFLTKGIAAGVVLALALAFLAGADMTTRWARWGTPLVAGIFLLLTGILLVWDLKRPDRFYYLLTKGNPGSWLVRGAWILGAYGAVLGVWFVAGVSGSDGLVKAMLWIGVPLAVATAGYTAFLFGQAEARDLWQSPTLLWHMLAGAFAAGGGAAALFSTVLYSGGARLTAGSRISPDGFEAFVWAMIGGAVALGLIAIGELIGRHPTRNIEAAMHHMTRGHFARQWWLGGQALGVLVPVVLGWAALATGQDALASVGALGAMAGIWAADDAMVKAGQAVPLS